MRHLESKLQQSCVGWFRLQYRPLTLNLFAVGNGGARSRIEAAIMNGEGVTAGVADLLLLVPRHNYHGLCIEMKTLKGRQAESQKLWQQAVEAQGYRYEVVRSFDEFKKLIDWYLKNE